MDALVVDRGDSHMKVRDSDAFVTGTNRGIGLAFVQELLVGGARKVYAAARNPEGIKVDGVHLVRLDVTKPDTIAAARPLGQKWRPTTLGRSCSVAHSLRSWRRTAGVPSSTFFPY
jgi:hypothetical protein